MDHLDIHNKASESFLLEYIRRQPSLRCSSEYFQGLP